MFTHETLWWNYNFELVCSFIVMEYVQKNTTCTLYEYICTCSIVKKKIIEYEKPMYYSVGAKQALSECPRR
jgi:hypothetical protein